MNTFKCEVVSANGSIYSGEVAMLIAATQSGEIGVLHGHIPMVTLLKPGPIRVQFAGERAGEEEVIYVSGGVMEVQPHVVTVLADTAIRAGDIDEAAVLEAKRNAESLLANQSSDLDSAAALAALAESVAQMQTLNKLKNRA